MKDEYASLSLINSGKRDPNIETLSKPMIWFIPLFFDLFIIVLILSIICISYFAFGIDLEFYNSLIAGIGNKYASLIVNSEFTKQLAFSYVDKLKLESITGTLLDTALFDQILTSNNLEFSEITFNYIPYFDNLKYFLQHENYIELCQLSKFYVFPLIKAKCDEVTSLSSVNPVIEDSFISGLSYFFDSEINYRKNLSLVRDLAACVTNADFIKYINANQLLVFIEDIQRELYESFRTKSKYSKDEIETIVNNFVIITQYQLFLTIFHDNYSVSLSVINNHSEL